MSNTPKKNHNRGQTLDGHTQIQRHKAIREILSDKKMHIVKLDNLVEELEKRKIKTTQATMTRDKEKLQFKLVNENGTVCYRMPDTAMHEELDKEINAICKSVGITRKNIAQKIKTYNIRTNGHSHLLAGKLKMRFPAQIIDTLPLENVLTIYYIDENKSSIGGYSSFVAELEDIMTRRNPPID